MTIYRRKTDGNGTYNLRKEHDYILSGQTTLSQEQCNKNSE